MVLYMQRYNRGLRPDRNRLDGDGIVGGVSPNGLTPLRVCFDTSSGILQLARLCPKARCQDVTTSKQPLLCSTSDFGSWLSSDRLTWVIRISSLNAECFENNGRH